MALMRDRDPAPVGALTASAFSRYSVALRRYLVRRIRRPEDIADITQEVFELFVRRKDKLETVRDPLAYLFRIAFHVVGDAIADERRNPLTMDPALLGEGLLPESPGSSRDDAEELAVREDVVKALRTLPESHLAALMLVDGEGMSYKQAAQASGFTPNTIATYVMHGRAALKLALDDGAQTKGGSR